MKRILSLVLIFLLLFTLIGCNRFSKSEEATQNSGEEETEGTKKPKSLDDLRFVETDMFSHSPTMFENLINATTHVVVAKFIKRSTFCREENASFAYLEYMYKFEVVKCLRGNSVPVKLFLPDKFRYKYKSNILNDTGYLGYEEGKNYLLLLRNTHSEISFSFDFVDNTLILPIDDNGKIDSGESLLFQTQLEQSIRTDEAKQALEDGNLLTYILNAVKDNAEVIKYRDFIESDDFFEIYDATSYVAIVHIEEPREYPRISVDYDYGKAYSCEVLTWIKGDAGDETINIKLPLSKIEKTGKYVLLLTKKENFDIWHLSGYQSVYSEDEVSEILKR